MDSQLNKRMSARLPSGVMAALATPLDERGQLDEQGVIQLLDSLMLYSVSGICPVGSTGENPLLERATRVRLTSMVAERVPHGVWNIPASMSNTLAEVVEDIRSYSDAGAHAALVTPPFYYQHNSEAVRRWFESVVESSPLPIILYNIPAFTKISAPPEVVAHLAKDPRVIGMKDSSRDMEYFENILKAVNGSSFSLLTGTDTLLLASGILGGSGTIAASVNLVPEIVTGLWDAITSGSWESARELQNKLLAIVSACRESGFPSGWKAALSLKGLCSNFVAFPNMPVAGPSLDKLAQMLNEAGVVLRVGI